MRNGFWQPLHLIYESSRLGIRPSLSDPYFFFQNLHALSDPQTAVMAIDLEQGGE